MKYIGKIVNHTDCTYVALIMLIGLFENKHALHRINICTSLIGIDNE